MEVMAKDYLLQDPGGALQQNLTYELPIWVNYVCCGYARYCPRACISDISITPYGLADAWVNLLTLHCVYIGLSYYEITIYDDEIFFIFNFVDCGYCIICVFDV